MGRRGRAAAALAVTMSLLLLISAGGTGQVFAQSTRTTADTNVMVTMRDGVRLATDIYRPDAPGTYPVILARTPYNKDGSKDDGTYFAQQGYVYVVQDTRGRYASEGNFDIYVQDDTDGYDTALWLTGQPWFSPASGFALYGGSYLASTALDVALTNPPNLKTMYIYIASSNYHQDGAWRGGAFQLAHNVFFTDVTICPNQIARQARSGGPASAAAPLPRATDVGQILALEQATPLDQHLFSQNCPWYRNWAMNETENWYWDQPGLNHEPLFESFPHIPVALLGGWYDQFLGGTIIDYQAALAHTGQPVSLTVGPWIHGLNKVPTAGEGLFRNSATVDQRADALHWFNRFMKGGDASAPPTDVRYFLMGGGSGERVTDAKGAAHIDIGGEWQEAPTWPLPNTQYVPYYLHANGALNTTAPGAESPSTYTYDPSQPVPTLGGNISSGDIFAPAGAYDQRCRSTFPVCGDSTQALADRPDVLVFQTDPLETDVTVVGPLEADLWAASTAVDTDFTAKLVDVYPNGTAVNIADGIQRARYREDRTTPRLLQPGAATDYHIDLWHTAIVFKAGHRIRLDISSSNFPHYDRNLNTGNPIGSDVLEDAVTADQTVFHSARWPSRIVLPLVASPK